MSDKAPPPKLSMEVDPNTIAVIVREAVNMQMAVAFKSAGIDFTSAVVTAIMDAHVDNDGKLISKGHYGYERAKSWFDHEIQKLIREQAQKAMSDFVQAESPKIHKAMLAMFKKRSPAIVKDMTEATVAAFAKGWGFRFNVDLHAKE
jgi:hypothetical protein